MGLFNQDWSWDALKGQVGGLMSDPNQQRALLENPMFNMGMGLLSANADPNTNAFQGLMGGLNSANDQKTAADERARAEAQREELSALFKQMQQQQGGASNMPQRQQQPWHPGLIAPGGPGQPLPQMPGMPQQMPPGMQGPPQPMSQVPGGPFSPQGGGQQQGSGMDMQAMAKMVEMAAMFYGGGA